MTARATQGEERSDPRIEESAPDDLLPPPPYGPLPVGSARRVWARREPDEAERKALSSPLRLQILRLALHEPRTNQELAQALGKHPATLLHHVRALVDTGFLTEQAPRRGRRGSREVPYRASGKSWYLDDAAGTAGGGSDLLLRTFLEDVRLLAPGALSSTRLGFRLSEGDRAEFLDRLHALLTELAERPSDPGGEPWGLYVGLHPEPSAGTRRADP